MLVESEMEIREKTRGSDKVALKRILVRQHTTKSRRSPRKGIHTFATTFQGIALLSSQSLNF